MYCNNKINKETFVNLLILLLFMVLTFVTGIHHEPWADEAQAWLIARDCTFSDMLFNVLKYEGHPILWFIILRFLNFVHYPYELFFVVPWIAGSFGTYLLLFKSKLPRLIKYLFPFTFFVFYQSTIIARNHSLLFPVLAAVAVCYKDRLKKTYIYAMLLVLAASISAFSFFITFILLCFFIKDIIRTDNYSWRKFIPPLCVLIYMGLTALYLVKPADAMGSAEFDIIRLNPLEVFYTVINGFFNTAHETFILLFQGGIAAGLYIMCGKIFCKTKGQILLFVLINFGLIIMISAIVYKPWHSAYIIITLIFLLWLLTEDNKLKIPYYKNKIFYIFLTFIFAVHIFWNIKCSLYDIKNNYCASKPVSEFLKENNLTSGNIHGLGFRTVAISPYFSEKLYDNFSGKSFWIWKSSFYYAQKDIIEKKVPVVILEVISADVFQNITAPLEKDYTKHYFNGYICAKGKLMEDQSFIVYVKKNLN